MPHTPIYLSTIGSPAFEVGLHEISEHVFNIKQERQIRDLFIRVLNGFGAGLIGVAEEPREGLLKSDLAIYGGRPWELRSQFEMKFQYPADLTPSLCSTFTGDALKLINGRTCSHFLLVTQEAEPIGDRANIPCAVVTPLNYQGRRVESQVPDEALQRHFNCVHRISINVESQFLRSIYHFWMYHRSQCEELCVCKGWESERIA